MDKYFATLPATEIGNALVEKKDCFYQYLERCGRSELLRRVHSFYYKSGYKRGQLTSSGSVGQFKNMNINHFRNLVEHRKSLLINQRIAFEPQATNTDKKSQSQTLLAVGLLDYYSRVKRMEYFISRAAEFAILYGEGFLYRGWSPTGGKVFSKHPDTGAPVFEGDIDFASLTTWDVIRDTNARSFEESAWIIVRRFKNKFDLAEKFKAVKINGSEETLGERILDHTCVPQSLHDSFTVKEALDNSELIPVWTFLHKPTEALPNGRLVEFISADTILADGPIPYRGLPISRLAAGEQDDEVFGYSSSFDLLPIQEALDKLYSVILTNQSAFGVQNIKVPRGSGINVTRLPGGLNLVEYDSKAGAPEPLNLTQTPVEIFSMIDRLEKSAETISGVNSVARGNPESNLRSGNALALVQTMAIQFAQALQQSYIQMLEDAGTGIIQLLQDYAEVPRVALIVGKVNRSYVKEFKRTDLDLIERVQVNMANPLSKTVAGRAQMAENLLQYKMIATPQQYLEVLTTGRLEPVLEGEMAELMLIREENEKLQVGEPVEAIITDEHAIHIQEHKAVVASIEARNNVPVLQATLSHIMKHQKLMGTPAMGQAGPVEGQSAGETLNNEPAVAQESESVRLPSMPTVAGSDQKFNPEGA